jgi:diguanylate cyclase (GGDEF)-like protein
LEERRLAVLRLQTVALRLTQAHARAISFIGSVTSWRGVLAKSMACAAWLLAVSTLHAQSVTLADALHAADKAKSSDNTAFAKQLEQIAVRTNELNASDQLTLSYLQGWQKAYTGDYDSALPILHGVIRAAPSTPLGATIKTRAIASVVNIQAIARRYIEAFTHFHELLTLLPNVTDREVRQQGYLTAAFMHNQVGEYALGQEYAQKLLSENPPDNVRCKALQLSMEAQFRAKQLNLLAPEIAESELSCARSKEMIFLSLARTYVAQLMLPADLPGAIAYLQRHRDQVLETKYPRAISDYEALLAQAYWTNNDPAQAMSSGLSAVANSVRKENTAPLVTAFRVLYLVAQQRGDSAEALNYHKSYMAAEIGLMDDIGARQLAYEKVKLQTDALSKQNQVLKLEEQLSRKKAENSTLYIALLLCFLASIGYFAYRTKRSQLHFQRLAATDGLTSVSNRQHFMSEAERELSVTQRSGTNAAVAIVDLDHFKLINDRYGHPVGDIVLREAVAACVPLLRRGDRFGRLGGEEFGVLLRDCTLEQALVCMERFRHAIENCVIRDGDKTLDITASFGLTQTRTSGFVLRKLLADADRALYQAKNEGRNRIVVFSAAAS